MNLDSLQAKSIFSDWLGKRGWERLPSAGWPAFVWLQSPMVFKLWRSLKEGELEILLEDSKVAVRLAEKQPPTNELERMKTFESLLQEKREVFVVEYETTQAELDHREDEVVGFRLRIYLSTRSRLGILHAHTVP